MIGKASLHILGDVQLIIEGKADPEAAPAIELSRHPFALGAGKFSLPFFFGETLILFGSAHGTIMTERGEALPQSQNKHLATPFLMGMKVERLPSRLEIFENHFFSDVLAQLGKRVALGCFYVAHAYFDLFKGVYLKKSPIFQENINENKEKYWQHPNPLAHRHAFLFGFLATEEGKKKIKDLNKAFYQNPNEQERQEVQSHTHAVIVSKSEISQSWEEMESIFLQAEKELVYHFLPSSFLNKSSFALFELG